MTATERTLKYLRDQGYTVGIVERYNSFTKQRHDLFGFIDLIAVQPGTIVGVQSTVGSNHADRRKKILAEPRAQTWLSAGGKIMLISWSKCVERYETKKGVKKKRDRWKPRAEFVEPPDFNFGLIGPVD